MVTCGTATGKGYDPRCCGFESGHTLGMTMPFSMTDLPVNSLQVTSVAEQWAMNMSLREGGFWGI